MMENLNTTFFALAFIVFVVGIVMNWKNISHWIGHIQPPDWLNALAMVIALGVIPMIMFYGRWILGLLFLILLLVNLH